MQLNNETKIYRFLCLAS